jgi:hypothetical protein
VIGAAGKGDPPDDARGVIQTMAGALTEGAEDQGLKDPRSTKILDRL